MWPFDKFRKKQKPRPTSATIAPVRMSGGFGNDHDDNIIPMAVHLSMYNNMIPPGAPVPENPAQGWSGDGSYTYPSDNSGSMDSSSSYDSGSSTSDSGSGSSD